MTYVHVQVTELSCSLSNYDLFVDQLILVMKSLFSHHFPACSLLAQTIFSWSKVVFVFQPNQTLKIVLADEKFYLWTVICNGSGKHWQIYIALPDQKTFSQSTHFVLVQKVREKTRERTEKIRGRREESQKDQESVKEEKDKKEKADQRQRKIKEYKKWSKKKVTGTTVIGGKRMEKRGQNEKMENKAKMTYGTEERPRRKS